MAAIQQSTLAQALQPPAQQQLTQVDPMQLQQQQMMQPPDMSKLADALGSKWAGASTPDTPLAQQPEMNQMQAANNTAQYPSVMRSPLSPAMQQNAQTPYWQQMGLYGMGGG